MAFYRVMNTFVDTVNGYHPKAGNFIETEDKEWVARMGSSLREELICPNNVEVVKVANTLESQAAAQAKVVVEEQKVAAPAKDTARLNIPNKAVLEPGEQK